jgi:hypothetical protein
VRAAARVGYTQNVRDSVELPEEGCW